MEALRHIGAAHPTSKLELGDLKLPKNRRWFWPHCDTCGRHIAAMPKHLADHKSGRFDDRGVRQDPEGRESTRKRLTSRYGRVNRARWKT